jgi:hypothetical protein
VPIVSVGMAEVVADGDGDDDQQCGLGSVLSGSAWRMITACSAAARPWKWRCTGAIA